MNHHFAACARVVKLLTLPLGHTARPPEQAAYHRLLHVAEAVIIVCVRLVPPSRSPTGVCLHQSQRCVFFSAKQGTHILRATRVTKSGCAGHTRVQNLVDID